MRHYAKVIRIMPNGDRIEYDSVRAAAKAVHVDHTTIYSRIRNGTQTKEGDLWIYKDSNVSKYKPIVRITRFRSVRDASKQVYMTERNMFHILEKGRDRQGNRWMYEEDVAKEKLRSMNPETLLDELHRQYRLMMNQSNMHPRKGYEANGMWQAIQIIESLMGDENQ